MKPEELFEEKQHLVFAAIKQQFGSYHMAKRIAENNNMEFDDLVQVGNMYLWERCVKHDPERIGTFSAYVMRGLRWYLSNEIHLKGTLFKVSRYVSVDERNQIETRSIDLHRDGEVINDFFAVSDIDVEEEVTTLLEFEEVTGVLNGKEKAIILHIGEGYTAEEIAVRLGMGKSTVHQKKNAAFLKINPDYQPVKRSFFLGKLPYKRNRQLGLTV
ncbi:sigma-70 family RNA polymerase sigma factor [Bacillus thuringiensis]|nr:sigma-70 family RNA polymerase sigma factor [Bacillus thuringiensis]